VSRAFALDNAGYYSKRRPRDCRSEAARSVRNARCGDRQRRLNGVEDWFVVGRMLYDLPAEENL